MKLTTLCAIAALLLSGRWLEAKPTIYPPFTANMVLQRDQPVPVWGWADPGEAISVTFAGQEHKATADASGRWRVTLQPLAASAGGRELKVAGKETVTLANVLVGEVWLCGGQSNMGLTLSEVFNAEQEVAAANYPAIRYLGVPPRGSLLIQERPAGGMWRLCSPETAGSFAGVAYFYGRALHRELGVPIGLIEFDRGSTGIECWVPLTAYKASPVPTMQEIARRVESWNPATPRGREAHESALAALEKWLPLARAALDAGRAPAPMPRVPVPDTHQASPCEVFNGTISPLSPYALRGAVWYQGESNPGEGWIYEQKMKALISGWRQAWGRPDLPFYYVQLANEGLPALDPDEDPFYRYVPVREAQRRVMAMPHTGMVVAIDLGEDANGHPRNKLDVGERLARWALAKNYGRKVPVSGPMFKAARRQGNRMILSFDYAGSGLMVGDKDGLQPVQEVKAPLQYFAVAGADGRWHWGDARIVGNTVEVSSPRVAAPARLRYAYVMNPKGPKLYNREGLPASPFRTWDWQPEDKGLGTLEP